MYYRFIWKENVSTSEHGTRTYGIKAVEEYSNYQSYDEMTKKYTKVRFPYTAGDAPRYQDSENAFQILSQDSRTSMLRKTHADQLRRRGSSHSISRNVT